MDYIEYAISRRILFKVPSSIRFELQIYGFETHTIVPKKLKSQKISSNPKVELGMVPLRFGLIRGVRNDAWTVVL